MSEYVYTVYSIEGSILSGVVISTNNYIDPSTQIEIKSKYNYLSYLYTTLQSNTTPWTSHK